MTAHPWMPLYVGDYLSKTQRLDAAEHGAYLLLIMEYWQAGEPPPDDDHKLARICRMTPREWRKVKPAVAPFFYDGWHHRRIEEELAKADVKHGRRVDAGKRGGIASTKAKQTPSNATSNAQASSSQSQPQPESEQEKTNTQTAAPIDGGQQAFELAEEPEPLTNGSGAYPEDFEDLWREYRVVGPKTASKSSAHKAFAKLSSSDRKACWSGVVNYAVLVMDERKRRADYPVKHLATFINERGWEPFLEDVA